MRATLRSRARTIRRIVVGAVSLTAGAAAVVVAFPPTRRAIVERARALGRRARDAWSQLAGRAAELVPRPTSTAPQPPAPHPPSPPRDHGPHGPESRALQELHARHPPTATVAPDGVRNASVRRHARHA